MHAKPHMQGARMRSIVAHVLHPASPVCRVQKAAGALLLVVCLTMATSLMSASVAVHLVRWGLATSF